MGKMRFLSKNRRSFQNRNEAGRLLGNELKNLDLKQPIVLGIPRGGIVVAREAALILDCDMDVVLSRKLGAPGNPELAIGAITEDGSVFMNDTLSSRIGVFSSYVEEEKARQFSVITARNKRYREILPKAALAGKTLIIIDDGVATGATMQAALWVARRENPSYLIAAAPVGAVDALERLSEDADEVICLYVPSFFAGVGQFYVEFSQVDDRTVEEIIREESEKEDIKMSRKALEDMEKISRKVGHVMIATADRKGIPHIAAASKVSVVSDLEVRVDGWFCTKTEQNLRENSQIALVVWDREFDSGFQLIGECRSEKDIAVLDGYAPGIEERERFPQFERELLLKVNSIMEFKRALHNDLEEVRN